MSGRGLRSHGVLAGISISIVLFFAGSFFASFSKAEAAPGDSPLTIGSNLLAWYDAQDASTLFADTGCTQAATNNGNVGCWKDKSGNNATMTQPAAAFPMFRSTDINGKPSIKFAGDAFMYAVSGATLPANSAYTKFAVFKYDDTTSQNNIISSIGDGHAMYGSAGPHLRAFQGTGDILAADNSISTANYYIAAVRYGQPSGLSNKITINGEQKASNTTQQNYTAQPLVLGSHSGVNFLNGKIAEAVVYAGALSDADVAHMECYLSDRWGIAVSHSCTASLTVSNVKEFQTFQRNAQNKADIPVAGQVPISGCTTVEASFNNGNFTVIDSTISNGNFSGTLANQAAGQGAVTVRCQNDLSLTTTIQNVGIGDVFVIAGQSNAEGYGFNNQSFSHPSLKAAAFDGESHTWKIGNDKLDSTSMSGDGSPWPLLATKIMAKTGVPVAFIAAAHGGSTLAVPGSSGWDKAGGGADYAAMLSAIQDSGTNAVKGVLWHQGETDAMVGVSQSMYFAALQTLVANFKADLPGAPKTYIASLGEIVPPDSNIPYSNPDGVRAAVAQAWNQGGDFGYGPTLYDIGPLPDHVHFRTDEQLQTLADRWWFALDAQLYNGSESRGPRIQSAALSADKTQLFVNFTGKLPVSPLSMIEGIIVTDNGQPVQIGRVAGIRDNSIRLSLAAPVTNPTITFGSGNAGLGESVIRDSQGLPAEVAFQQAVTQTTPDSDGDGLTDVQEDAVVSGGDANADMIADKLQPNVATIQNTVNKAPQTLVVPEDCTLATYSTIAATLTARTKANKDFPLGLSDFTAYCPETQTEKEFSILYDKTYDTKNWQLMRFYPDRDEYMAIKDVSYGAKKRSDQTVTTASYVIEDNGALDSHPRAGVIADPVGPGVSITDTAGSLPATGQSIFIIILSAMSMLLLAAVGVYRYKKQKV